jgi:hypothetical protein
MEEFQIDSMNDLIKVREELLNFIKLYDLSCSYNGKLY